MAEEETTARNSQFGPIPDVPLGVPVSLNIQLKDTFGPAAWSNLLEITMMEKEFILTFIQVDAPRSPRRVEGRQDMVADTNGTVLAKVAIPHDRLVEWRQQFEHMEAVLRANRTARDVSE